MARDQEAVLQLYRDALDKALSAYLGDDRGKASGLVEDLFQSSKCAAVGLPSRRTRTQARRFNDYVVRSRSHL
jgi:hypothetical protein